MRSLLPFPVLFAFSLTLFMGGCRTVALDNAGQAQAAYNNGRFIMVMHNTAAQLAPATEQALKSLDLFMVSKDVQNYSAEFKARTRKDKKVSIKIEEVNSRETMLYIKVGLRGDLPLSRALYEQIEQGAQRTGGEVQSHATTSHSSWGQPLSGELR